ncbi:pilus assembly protein [Cupriavidus taiwanensis]|uniref:pilus assembly protein n=1 Tax=Cupriavidus taiwanensis TaxID=164546 RepID=UPI000E10A5BD|nr:PilC/PilY family type IV pilus protein [Cupriavidus taiwanensis]SOY54324.1 TYPE 4 FIMBRIAL BIOGENESIS PILY1-RELATED PROTEIN; SIGNAL PEPTIDE [Cupriavidus taiwanensis]SOY55174.1 TYPE 4 FIMBRIAL BIOGENESIS PILY1-RELATED PROTEIN; SIGNAL PEPTIDE [Cupriavidus taiwanensis]SOY89183.1 TYPE 4 FIMBRIAL BIOGENESIS PILY1-RELATED PROTEIN; SIGNAL PEPTIDE [Cupriavidus taiwanensis]SOZ61433.1 TYPE 4 FIMBRIAL BIOGENESIS PILY1-RELATED PROTEIN; SIGNAL PEPTIDE [Cupriavidus taiwanensis]SOZ81500.1 TYPE 4 FIMBRIAL 
MSMPARRLRAYAACATALFGLAAAPAAQAEDIDLFTGLQSNAGARPNVLLILDNASAWNANAQVDCETPGVVGPNNQNNNVGAEQCALYKAVSDLINDDNTNGKINLGVMMFGGSNNSGAQFRFPSVTPPTAPSGLVLLDRTTGGPAMLEFIKSIDRTKDSSNNSQVGGAMQEAWAFFSGKTGLSGTTYKSPITNPCQKNFIIYIANALNNGKPQDTGQDAYNKLREAGATAAQLTPIPLSKANNIDNWGDEWARFLNGMDLNATNNAGSATATRQNIITYTIGVTDGSKQSLDYLEFVNSMASKGGGGNFTVRAGDDDALAKALKDIFNEMQAVNNVFASVSLPVSVNGQGSYLNQVYIGMFRPDGKARPRWVGNLKQYKLGYDTNGNLVMLDAGLPGGSEQTSKSAISNAGTGFISPNARSYWTEDPPTQVASSSIVTDWPADGFWKNASAQLRNAKDAPDGEIVEKGGAGEMLRADYLTSQSGRRLLTCANAKCSKGTALAGFNAANKALTEGNGPSLLKTTAADVANMIDWVRGKDVFAALTGTDPKKEAEPGPGGNVTVRGSIHGDVLHSRPVVVDYGGSTGVVVFYGANDGVFHAVNGNRTGAISTSTGTVRAGGELWGFIPPEFYGKLARLYNNAPEVRLTGSPEDTAEIQFTPRDYFFDGTTTVYQNLSNPAAPEVTIYLTARRGGRLVYALDVSDPAQPKYLWSKTSADIPELGQTWSQPRVMRVRGYRSPVLIMGAGYDPDGEDSDPALGGEPTATNQQGRGVLVLDAGTGDVVWAALANCSGITTGTCVTIGSRAIPSDVAVVDRNGDGYADKAYVGDLGGNVWRIDFGALETDVPSTWSIGKLAQLGGAVNSNDARKFLYPPDVVATGKYDAVMIASGDREKPLYSLSQTPGAAQNVRNRFYMVKDPNVDGKPPATWAAVKEADLVDATSVAYRDTATASGFYLALEAGEKAVNAPLTVAGYTYFGTNTPSKVLPGACYPDLGVARGYAVSFLTGLGMNNGPRYVTFDNGGLPPSPVFGMVSVTQTDGSTRLVPVLIGGGKAGGGGGDDKSSLGGQEVKPASAGKRKRTYWYTQSDKT